MARPRAYNADKATEILALLADGQSMRSICARPDMPSRPTVFGWVFDDIEGFSGRYARAREMQAQSLADDLTEIADNGTNDWMARNDPDNPGYTANGEHMQRSRLRVDTRKWVAAKILPKQYGDKMEMEHSGQVATISASPLTPEDWAKKHGGDAT